MQCDLFQHSRTQPGSCTLISTNGGDTITSAKHNVIYNMGELPIVNESLRLLIVVTVHVQSELIVHIKLIHVLKNPQKVTCFKVGIEMKRLDPPHWMLISYNNNNNSRVFVYEIFIKFLSVFLEITNTQIRPITTVRKFKLGSNFYNTGINVFLKIQQWINVCVAGQKLSWTSFMYFTPKMNWLFPESFRLNSLASMVLSLRRQCFV